MNIGLLLSALPRVLPEGPGQGPSRPDLPPELPEVKRAPLSSQHPHERWGAQGLTTHHPGRT